jgi:hypothetical protein
MHLSRLILTGTTVLALSLAAGCSDDPDEQADAEPTTSANPTKEARNACEADVELTGDVKKSWTGEAFAITENQSGPVLYRATKGNATLTLLAGDDQFDALGTLTVGKKRFTTSSGTVDVDPDGKGAEVDADASGSGDKGGDAHIVATFTC